MVKDLVPDLTPAFAQYRRIDLWLKADTPAPPDGEPLQSKQERTADQRHVGVDPMLLLRRRVLQILVER